MSDTLPQATTITISTGTLRGTEADGIMRFLGVPFARPPFGDLRFSKPVPVEPWDGERDATAFGPTAPQDPYRGPIGELLSTVEIPGEDILTANVWAPSDGIGMGLPVMVWFHGGALEHGSPALAVYDGTSFAREGLVFVSLAYRVGSEGFSMLEDAPLNLGLEDAAAGLAWVHREIAAFGGDPDRITIAGQSAGGSVVAALLMRSESRAVVRGAIVQSGPLRAETPERAGRATRAIAQRLGVEPTRAAFTRLTPRDLLAARAEVSAGSTAISGAPGFALAVDPDSLPVSPDIGLGRIDTPLLIGSTADEYRLWFTPEELAKIGRFKVFAARLATRTPASVVAAYRRAYPGALPGEILGQIIGDRLVRAPAIRAAETRSARTYVYEFAWSSPVRDLRAAHAMDIGFVFRIGYTPDALAMAGPNPPAVLADRMHTDWARFVETQDAGWPVFDEKRVIRRYDTETTEVVLPRAEALDSLPL
ncbi:carboxylesterase/lipase family protein [Microbacterium sp. ASV49]|uniref:Carboxylic ester hydrolase n=1 Tax=Microbacterium candidum TaxID=3041922 RepID=A0ABT7MYX2_9MICO|nr:carboxylesterase family protein [Microbacterium sp. ASV49]MDL9979646.1 carboxylesterase family protein [Microbacterium sp. ASV49]